MTTGTIRSERIDDIPLLMHWLLEMHIDTIIDAAIGAPHANRRGLSYGQLAVVYVAYMLSQCRHFLSPVREWVAKHQQCLTQALGQAIGDTDFTDDRLEDLLDAIGQEDVGEKIEKQLGQHLIRAYALPTDTARIDTTTVNVYHHPEAGSILDYGVSKDHRPDLRQFKEVLSTLDPVGIPLCSAMVAGHCADDPLYVPIWHRMVEVIGRADFLVVGDCKLASLANRAQIQQGGGYYLAPLAMTGDAPEQLRHWVFEPPVPLSDLYLPGVEERIGQGFEVVVAQIWTPPKTEAHVIWHERVFVMRSDKFAQRNQQGLAARLQRTEFSLETGVTPRGSLRGKGLGDRRILRYRGAGRPDHLPGGCFGNRGSCRTAGLPQGSAPRRYHHWRDAPAEAFRPGALSDQGARREAGESGRP